MNLEVKAKTISPKQVLSITKHVNVGNLSQTIEESLGTMYEMLKEQNAEAASPPFGIYLGAINEKDDGPIEICLPVRGQIEGTENVVFKQLNGGAAACVNMLGEQCEFPSILKGYDAISAWIETNGHQKFGPPREVWHTGPGPDAKMEIVWFYR